jgi:hypothetical protein
MAEGVGTAYGVQSTDDLYLCLWGDMHIYCILEPCLSSLQSRFSQTVTALYSKVRSYLLLRMVMWYNIPRVLRPIVFRRQGSDKRRHILADPGLIGLD